MLTSTVPCNSTVNDGGGEGHLYELLGSSKSELPRSSAVSPAYTPGDGVGGAGEGDARATSQLESVGGEGGGGVRFTS